MVMLKTRKGQRLHVQYARPERGIDLILPRIINGEVGGHIGILNFCEKLTLSCGYLGSLHGSGQSTKSGEGRSGSDSADADAKAETGSDNDADVPAFAGIHHTNMTLDRQRPFKD